MDITVKIKRGDKTIVDVDGQLYLVIGDMSFLYDLVDVRNENKCTLKDGVVGVVKQSFTVEKSEKFFGVYYPVISGKRSIKDELYNYKVVRDEELEAYKAANENLVGSYDTGFGEGTHYILSKDVIVEPTPEQFGYERITDRFFLAKRTTTRTTIVDVNGGGSAETNFGNTYYDTHINNKLPSYALLDERRVDFWIGIGGYYVRLTNGVCAKVPFETELLEDEQGLFYIIVSE